MKYRLILFLAIFLFSGCGSSDDRLQNEEDVYKALIRYIGGDDLKVLVIRETSTAGREYVQRGKNKNKLYDEAFTAFILVNKNKSLLPIDSTWDQRVILLSEEKFDSIFSKPTLELSWKSFYNKYPDSTGLIGLSRVGFNEKVNEALLYIEIGCGALCGNGYYAWMSKGLFGWKVDLLEHLWVS